MTASVQTEIVDFTDIPDNLEGPYISKSIDF